MAFCCALFRRKLHCRSLNLKVVDPALCILAHFLFLRKSFFKPCQLLSTRCVPIRLCSRGRFRIFRLASTTYCCRLCQWGRGNRLHLHHGGWARPPNPGSHLFPPPGVSRSLLPLPCGNSQKDVPVGYSGFRTVKVTCPLLQHLFAFPKKHCVSRRLHRHP